MLQSCLNNGLIFLFSISLDLCLSKQKEIFFQYCFKTLKNFKMTYQHTHTIHTLVGLETALHHIFVVSIKSTLFDKAVFHSISIFFLLLTFYICSQIM